MDSARLVFLSTILDPKHSLLSLSSSTFSLNSGLSLLWTVSMSKAFNLFHNMHSVAAGCIITGAMAVPPMQCPLFAQSWYSFCQPRKDDMAESTHLVLFHGPTGAQTQDLKKPATLPFIPFHRDHTLYSVSVAKAVSWAIEHNPGQVATLTQDSQNG